MNEMLAGLADAAELIELMERSPKEAAAVMRRWAGELTRVADQLAADAGPVSESGFNERIMVRCISGDGAAKQYVDTARIACPTCGRTL